MTFNETCTAISAGATVVAAVGAIAIPMVLYQESEENRRNDERIATQTRTLQVMDDLDEKITKIIEAKIRLDASNNVEEKNLFASTYIDAKEHRDVQTQVYRLLNIYDSVCLGAKNELFSKDIIESMRGDALRQTWQQYEQYIADHRKAKPVYRNAWENCDSWVAQGL